MKILETSSATTETPDPGAFEYAALRRCADGDLFGPGNAQLPSPPMLMLDRISLISSTGGAYDKGHILAEMDVKPSLWFFDCHFKNDPVMPGCLGLDAMWQLVGFFLGWIGLPGRGRALGVGDVKMTGQVLPDAQLTTYDISIKRVIRRRLTMAIADGVMMVDGSAAITAQEMRVGLFNTESQPTV